jgi:hypothetical protein
MANYDCCIVPVKRTSQDVGRKMKFWDDDAGTVAAVVKDLDGATLTQPIRVPASGHLELRFDQWPVYYTDNRAWSRVRMVPGMPATISSYATEGAAITNVGAGGDLDESVAKADIDDAGTIDGTEIAAAMSAQNARINALRTKLDELIDNLQAANFVG